MSEDIEKIVRGLKNDRTEHPYWCDCAGCWTGITVCAPKPLTVWERFCLRVRAYLEGTHP